MGLKAISDNGDSWTILDEDTGRTVQANKSDWNGQLPYGVTPAAPLQGAGRASSGPSSLVGTPPLDISPASQMPNDSLGGHGETGPELRSTQSGISMNQPDAVSGDQKSLAYPEAGPAQNASPAPPFAASAFPQPTMSVAAPQQTPAPSLVSTGASQSSSGGGKVASGSSYARKGFSTAPDARDAELLKIRAKAAQDEADAAKKQAEAQAAGGDTQANLIEEQTMKDDLSAPGRLVREAARRSRLNQALAESKRADDEYANARVDPDRYWHNRSTGQAINDAIQIGIAAFANADFNTAEIFMGKSPSKLENAGIKRIDDTIKEDLEQQRQDIDRKGRVADNRRTFVGLTRSVISDEREADEKAQALAWTQVAHRADIAALRAGSQATRLGAEAFAAQARDKAAAHEEAQRQIARENADKASARAAQWASIAEEKRHNQATEANAANKGQKLFYVYGPSGKPIGAYATEDEAKLAQKTLSARGDIESAYREGKELFKDGWAPPGTEDRAKQEAWDIRWINLGKNSDGDFSAPNQFDVDNRGVAGKFNPLQRLDETYNNAKKGAASRLKGYGGVVPITNDALINEGLIEPDNAVVGGVAGEKLTPPTLDVNDSVPVLDTATNKIYILTKQGYDDLKSRYPQRYREASQDELHKDVETTKQEREKARVKGSRSQGATGFPQG